MDNVKKPWLIALSAGRWQVSGIQAALDNGLRVLALDGDPNAVGLIIATKSMVVDIKDRQAVLAAIEQAGVMPDGVVSFVSEVGMPAAAIVRERYGLTGSDIKLTHSLTNKVQQRIIWDEKKISGPKWRKFISVNEAIKYVQEIGFPCIVKPTDSAGSRGVSKVECFSDFAEAAGEALNASQMGVALIESFMEGVEYTVETFSDGKMTHVLAVTEKKKVAGTKGTVAQELLTPADNIKTKIVSDIAVASLEALGYEYGPGHTEVILDQNLKPGLVEAAGRGGGFMVFEKMVEKVSGFDIVAATALQAIGLQVSVNVNKKRRFSVLRFIVSKKGVVKKIEGIEEACRLSGVEAGAFVTISQKVESVQGDGDRLAYILVEADSPEIAQSLADHAESLIKIKVG